MYAIVNEVEDRHWWFTSRRRLIEETLVNAGVAPGGRILEVGCGTGGSTRMLQRFGRVVGLDLSEEALTFARRKAPDARFVRANARDIARLFPEGTFDVVIFLNVLYHSWLGDTAEMLAEVRKVLRPGGIVVLTEPAFQFLMRKHDQQAMTARRYTLTDFRNYFRRAGLAFEQGRYFNAPAFPICLMTAMRDRIFGIQDTGHDENEELTMPGRWLNSLLTNVMSMERAFCARFPLPLGVTLLAVGRKP